MPRRRETHVFGLSFLDAMTCGFGAVILLYMVISASMGERAERVTSELVAEVDRLERRVLEEHEGLVELRNSLEQTVERRVEARGLAQRLVDRLEEIRLELATYEADTLARRESIERLKADVLSLEEEAKRLAAATPAEELPGDRRIAFVGDGDRQYLTGLKVGGSRILLLVDASASMLGEDLVNVLRRRNLPPREQLRAGKWRRAVAAGEWLLTQVPGGSRFQVWAFAERAWPVVDGTAGRWLDGGSGAELGRAVEGLRALAPAGGTSLAAAFGVVSRLDPAPDNVILITDGLPTQGARGGVTGTVSPKRRERFFREATELLPHRLPVNVLLLPMEGDPMAASAFWRLALATGGALVTPTEDWP